jgi:hypothetical protein
MKKGFFKAVFLTGLFVGTTDLIAAYISQWIKTGKYADKMLNYIAGGGLGLERSMNGGSGVQFLGLFFHYFIAFSFTLLFFLVFPRLKLLWYNKYMVGMLYGVFVSLIVGQVILRFTALPVNAFSLSGSIVGWLVLGAVLGIPIAYNTYRYFGVDSSFPKSAPLSGKS